MLSIIGLFSPRETDIETKAKETGKHNPDYDKAKRGTSSSDK